MSSIDHRLQRLEEALQPRSKGHVILLMDGGGDGFTPRPALSPEEAKREAARLRHEGYTVTILCFVAAEQAAVRHGSTTSLTVYAVRSRLDAKTQSPD